MNGFLSVQSIRNGTNNKNNKVATFISNSKTVNRAPPYIPERRLKKPKKMIYRIRLLQTNKWIYVDLIQLMPICLINKVWI